jgi:hypothetical protein
VFENRALGRIFEPKWDEVTGGCRKLLNEELHNLYHSSNIIRVMNSRIMIIGTACSTQGVKRNRHRILIGKAEGIRSLERPRRTLVDNKMVWTGLIWLRVYTSMEIL